jgi:hypothetical protein
MIDHYVLMPTLPDGNLRTSCGTVVPEYPAPPEGSPRCPVCAYLNSRFTPAEVMWGVDDVGTPALVADADTAPACVVIELPLIGVN